LSEDPKCVACGKFNDVLVSTRIGWLCQEHPYCYDNYVSILEENVNLSNLEIITRVKEH